jgi:hypothetical protein
MSTAATIASVVLAVLLVAAAARKLTHSPEVVESYRLAGVPEERLNLLALVLIAGGAGLLLGVIWAPIGIAAAIGVVVYFVGAIASHLRAGDAAHLPTPIALEAIAIATLALLIASAG